MANLDKLLRKIEKNKETENETKTYPLEIAGEKFDVRTMTRKERRDFIYSQDANSDTLKADDLVKKMKPFIYKALNLAPLAEKAKDAGYIKSYYDVIEELFEQLDPSSTEYRKKQNVYNKIKRLRACENRSKEELKRKLKQLLQEQAIGLESGYYKKHIEDEINHLQNILGKSQDNINKKR